jgi:putative mycofactocin binding protein MftB
LSVTEARADAPTFAVGGAWRLDPQVALRDESFGALAYHYGTRRLVFLKSRSLVALVTGLEAYPTVAAALDALAPPGERARYEAALSRLADSGVISAR